MNLDNDTQFETREVEVKGKKGHKKGMIIFAIIIIALIILGVGLKTLFKADKDVTPAGPYIGTIYVEGTISSAETDTFGQILSYQHRWTLDKIDNLIHDSNNKGLIIFVNSPGGGVYESDELYFKIKEYQEKTKRPVYSVMGSMAASGGYYISAPADKIIANRNTWTGSIGVTIGTLFDFSQLLERYGVKTKTITSGANKAMGSSVTPMTAEQESIFQSLVDESYEQFVGIVSEERGIDIEKTKKLADGRIYTARQALELNLIDEIGTMDDAVKSMKKDYKLDNCQVVDLLYEDTSFLGMLLNSKAFDGLISLGNIGGGDVSAIMNIVNNENEFPVSYMCEALKK
ncbi:signal peptide peptidase SppA [Anaerovorax odorimutans]|uniref:signal peptide peptidase SppA n=1 Tax=Anaerovorax odorimutans TaxID=109327 RepID=UPI00041CDD4F|nr:signal peptide peptidase SppA [Anaerovorax odorimutans]